MWFITVRYHGMRKQSDYILYLPDHPRDVSPFPRHHSLDKEHILTEARAYQAFVAGNLTERCAALKAEQKRAADEANKQIQKLHDGAKGCLPCVS